MEPSEEQAQSVESKKAATACADYLRMGIGRSLAKLHQKYIEGTANEPPTRHLRVLAGWSTKYGWQERANAHDVAIDAEKEQRRKEIMESGFALDYERVVELKRMAVFLSGQIYEQGEGDVYHNVWVADVKQIGSGEFAERVDIERFNGEIFSQLRGALDDLAKETGGRKQKTEITGKDGGPIETRELSKLSDEELERIASGSSKGTT